MDFDLSPPTPSTLNTSSSASTEASPIADLSYRNYDGELNTRLFRWWIVAIAMLRLTRKKVGFWILAALAAFPYIIVGFLIYGVSSQPGGIAKAFNNPILGEVSGPFSMPTQFWNALKGQGLFFMGITLLIGAGSISSDNRSNALLVYLSRPITRLDYLFGKWVGFFSHYLESHLHPRCFSISTAFSNL